MHLSWCGILPWRCQFFFKLWQLKWHCSPVTDLVWHNHMIWLKCQHIGPILPPPHNHIQYARKSCWSIYWLTKPDGRIFQGPLIYLFSTLHSAVYSSQNIHFPLKWFSISFNTYPFSGLRPLLFHQLLSLAHWILHALTSWLFLQHDKLTSTHGNSAFSL